MTLRGTMLAGQTAGPTLAEVQAIAKHRDRRTPTGRAQKFPRAISFSPSISNAWLATIRFNR
jgi:hypothetical protein